MLKRRQEEIKKKGFNLINEGITQSEDGITDYSKMKVGLRTVNDCVINVGTYKKINRNYGDKAFVLKAIYNHDYDTLREISNFFYESSGIYYRLCKSLAFLYRYDWYVTPYVIENSLPSNEKRNKKVLKAFSDVLLYLDKSEIKRVCGNIALDIVKEGTYNAYIVDFGDKVALQKLPANYCRTRFYSGVNPILELNLRFFDAYFPNPQQRAKVLELFPKDIYKAYLLFRQNKLPGDYPGDINCWYALDPETTIHLSLNDEGFPPFVGVIPHIIDLDQAQELDRQKTMQQLLKIIVQKLPLDKNGDLIFDVDEAKDIHNNAVSMLRRAIGIDVLTTFADIIKIDTKDNNSTTTKDDLEKVERSLYNASGTTHNIFNADGNLAVTNSILNDEASIREIPLQMASLLNRLIEKFNKKGQYEFRACMLETTQYNYKELSKLYKEQAQMGYAKMLPQIALGQPQSVILATINFENDILHLAEIMVPPMMSSVQSAKNLMGNNEQKTQNKNQNTQTINDNNNQKTGRPEKEDQEKSDKTIANRESQS